MNDASSAPTAPSPGRLVDSPHAPRRSTTTAPRRSGRRPRSTSRRKDAEATSAAGECRTARPMPSCHISLHITSWNPDAERSTATTASEVMGKDVRSSHRRARGEIDAGSKPCGSAGPSSPTRRAPTAATAPRSRCPSRPSPVRDAALVRSPARHRSPATSPTGSAPMLASRPCSTPVPMPYCVDESCAS